MRLVTRFGNSLYFFSASAAIACGSSFTASDAVDAGAGGTSGSQNPRDDGALGSSGTTAPDPRSDAYLDQIAPATGVWTNYAMPLIQSAFSSAQ